MSFFKKIVNKFNKKESLNIEHQFETTNNLKEIDNGIEIQEENWPEIQQNFDLNCGYKNGDSTPFDNDQFTSLTNNLENSVIESPRLFINGGNQSTSSTQIENSIKLSKKDFDYMLDPQQILFTQAQINSYFLGDDGFTVEDTINDLVTGKLKPQDLLIIRICLNEDNQYISADNRRLYCYQQAIQKGANFKKVLVRIVRETNEGAGFGWKRKKSLKIIENKIWNNVVVSHLARPNKICRENREV
ncbi:hypothetical protein C2G38_2163223 [Gigaspora rosea]|uniref:Uncharacterized protein n=1 Tax=Gigaspora rosea TaxID=44941 RepID=A0A397VYT7_9GLOM|nr:hypothetical protein C2G38_2163223 [Gigaspora rosea]